MATYFVVAFITLVAWSAFGDQAPPTPNSELERLAADAAARYNEGDNSAASALYQQLANRATSTAEHVSALMNVAWLEHLEGRDNTAINALTTALTLDPDHPFRPEFYTDAFGVLFDRGQERARQQREIDVADQVARALQLRSEGDFAMARQLLQQASALQPGVPQILLNLALLDLDQGLEDQALAGFERVLALAARPDAVLQPAHRAYALGKIGYLYNRRQRYDEAARSLEEAVTLSPESSTMWTNLGVARQQLGQTSSAADAFRQAVDLDPDDASAVANLALTYLDLDDAAGAAQLLDRASQRWPNDAALQLHRGRALRVGGDRAAALAAFELATRLDADNRLGHAAPAAALAARLHHEHGDPDRTLAMATQATRWDPDLVDGWILQGLALRALGQAPAALTRYEEALRREPTRADVHLQIGSISYQLHDFERAKTAFRRALEIEPDSTDARDNLAAVRARQPLGPPSSTTSAPSPSTEVPSKPSPVRSTSHPSLGLEYADFDYSDVGLDGVSIAAVAQHSPADRAGLRPNDLILKVDGRSMASASELERYLFTETRAIQFTIDLLRENRPVRVILRLE